MAEPHSRASGVASALVVFLTGLRRALLQPRDSLQHLRSPRDFDARFLEKSGPPTSQRQAEANLSGHTADSADAQEQELRRRVEIALQKSGAEPLDSWVLAYLMKLPTSDELICVDDRSHPYMTSPTLPKSTEIPE